MIERLNQLTNLVYQAALDGQWRPFIDELISATDACNGWVALIDKASGLPVFSEYISSIEGFSHEVFLELYMPRITEDPFFIHSASLQENECFRGSDIVPMENLPDYPLYPLFERAGCEYLISAIPVRNQHFDSFAAIHRHKGQSDFTDNALALVKHITPHINRAFNLHSKLLNQQLQLSTYKSVLDNNPYPLILIDEHQRMLQSNEKAEHILNQQSVLVNRNNRLVCQHPIQNAKLTEFVRSTLDWIQAKAPEPIGITLENGNENIMLKAYPVHAESEFNRLGRPCCIIEVLSNKSPQWRLFEERYLITPKELRTIKLLYEGLDLKQIAANESVSFNTVKSQLMSVYNKMNISSQRELMAELIRFM